MNAHVSRCRVLPRFFFGHLFLLLVGLLALAGTSLAGQLTLAWDPVAGATGYRVGFGTASGQYSATQDAGSQTTATVPGLSDGTRYYFAVQAYNATATSVYSSEVSAIVATAAAPVARFTASKTTGTAPLAVTFTDTSEGTVTSRSWNLGDGTSAASATVGKTYSTPGTYNIVLSVTGAGGTTTATKTITVAAPAPVASFTASKTTGTAPLNVTLTDTSTGTVTSRSWNLGDGTSAASATVVKTYSTSGTYRVVLTATGAGGTATATKTITVAAPDPINAPVADFTADVLRGAAPLRVNFADSSTGTIYSRSWTFGDGDTSTSRSPTHTYTEAGLYPVTLEVSGPGGTDTLTRRVSVEVDGADVPMEVGELVIDHQWQRVNFQRSYEDPIVVANPLSANDGDPATVRIDEVDPEGFSIRVEEWDYLDGTHEEETVTYMVMESGSHQLPDGVWVEAGRLETDATDAFVSAPFGAPFAEVPVVVTAVTSANGGDAVTSRLRNISTTGFEVGMKEQEGNQQSHVEELIDYIAWEPSFGMVNDLPYEVGFVPRGVSSKVKTLVYQGAFTRPPMVLAHAQTTNGTDTANLRQAYRDEVAVEIWVSEEQSRDTETRHIREDLGYFAIETDVTDPDPEPEPEPDPKQGSDCATPCSLWNDMATPSLTADPDSNAVELGVKFRSDTDGFITGIRYYKSWQNTGVHVGSLWSSSGRLLAKATFSNETASGWQSVDFPTPVAIKANTVYVASYHTNAGRYSVDERYFASAYENGPLRALADGESGGNGVYLYGSGGFPTNTYRSSNYWVDVVFTTP